MSLEVIVTIVCDNCGARESSLPCVKFTEVGSFSTSHKYDLNRKGWFTLSRGRFHKEAHYCPQCADKPVKPLKGKPRWKGPEATPEIVAALQPTSIIPDGNSVWVLISNEKRLSLAMPYKIIGYNGVFIQWCLRHRKGAFEAAQFDGWIFNSDLEKMIGKYPLR